jgi:hypothetical protein
MQENFYRAFGAKLGIRLGDAEMNPSQRPLLIRSDPLLTTQTGGDLHRSDELLKCQFFPAGGSLYKAG